MSIRLQANGGHNEEPSNHERGSHVACLEASQGLFFGFVSSLLALLVSSPERRRAPRLNLRQEKNQPSTSYVPVDTCRTPEDE